MKHKVNLEGTALDLELMDFQKDALQRRVDQLWRDQPQERKAQPLGRVPIKGVTYSPQRNQFRATVRIPGSSPAKYKHSRYYDTEAEAIAWQDDYKAKMMAHVMQFDHHGVEL